jgi:hypothetical protein
VDEEIQQLLRSLKVEGIHMEPPQKDQESQPHPSSFAFKDEKPSSNAFRFIAKGLWYLAVGVVLFFSVVFLWDFAGKEKSSLVRHIEAPELLSGTDAASSHPETWKSDCLAVSLPTASEASISSDYDIVCAIKNRKDLLVAIKKEVEALLEGSLETPDIVNTILLRKAVERFQEKDLLLTQKIAGDVQNKKNGLKSHEDLIRFEESLAVLGIDSHLKEYQKVHQGIVAARTTLDQMIDSIAEASDIKVLAETSEAVVRILDKLRYDPILFSFVDVESKRLAAIEASRQSLQRIAAASTRTPRHLSCEERRALGSLQSLHPDLEGKVWESIESAYVLTPVFTQASIEKMNLLDMNTTAISSARIFYSPEGVFKEAGATIATGS